MTGRTPTRARPRTGPVPVPGHGARAPTTGPTDRTEGNARMTGLTAAVLLVLLAAEGVTVLRVHALVTPHVVIGMVLVPVVLLKMGTTGWRIARYYQGSGPYRARGAPPLPLRLLGPVVVVSTVVVFASGIALLFVPHAQRASMFFVHKASFVLWFGVMCVHVLSHVLDTGRLAPADLVSRTRRQVRGGGARLWTQAGCLVAGVLLAVLVAPTIGPWLAGGGIGTGG